MTLHGSLEGIAMKIVDRIDELVEAHHDSVKKEAFRLKSYYFDQNCYGANIKSFLDFFFKNYQDHHIYFSKVFCDYSDAISLYDEYKLIYTLNNFIYRAFLDTEFYIVEWRKIVYDYPIELIGDDCEPEEKERLLGYHKEFEAITDFILEPHLKEAKCILADRNDPDSFPVVKLIGQDKIDGASQEVEYMLGELKYGLEKYIKKEKELNDIFEEID